MLKIIFQLLFQYLCRIVNLRFLGSQNDESNEEDSSSSNEHSNHTSNTNTSDPINNPNNSNSSDSSDRSENKHRRQITTIAAPGLMTLLDTALYRAHEGQLTSTVSSANVTLIAFIQLKSHAQRLLYLCHTLPPPLSLSQYVTLMNTHDHSSNISTDIHEAYQQKRKTHFQSLTLLTSFAAFCMECANGAIDRLTTDKLSKSANCEPSIHNSNDSSATQQQQQHQHHRPHGSNTRNGNQPIGMSASYNIEVDDDDDDDDDEIYSTNHEMTTTSSPQRMISSDDSSPIKSPSSSPNKNDKKQYNRRYVEEGIAASKYNSWNEIGLRCRSSSSSSHSECNGHHQNGNTSSSTNNYTTPFSVLNVLRKFQSNNNDETNENSNNNNQPKTSKQTINDQHHPYQKYNYNSYQKDCWESESLYCPDYVWADDAMLHCQRMVRLIMKHDAIEYIIDILHLKSTTIWNNNSNDNHRLELLFLPLLLIHYDNNSRSNSKNNNGYRYTRKSTKNNYYENMFILLSNIMALLKNDLPLRLHQFRCGIESDICVTKRLYLLKHECRAPFRAFLEGHDHLQRVPDLSLVEKYIELHDKFGGGSSDGGSKEIVVASSSSSTFVSENISMTKSGDLDGDNNIEESGNIVTLLKEKKKLAEKKIQECINNHEFQEALKMEYKCEMLEIEMGMLLLPFCNLARVLLDWKGLFHLVEVKDILPVDDVVPLQELLRRLKMILCKKSDADSSTGIRPILLDLEGIPRDSSPSSMEIYIFGDYDMTEHTEDEAIDKRLDVLCRQLHCLQDLCKSKGGFGIDEKEYDGLTSAMKACIGADVDVDSFQRKFKDWYSLCLKQQQQPDTLPSKIAFGDIKTDIEVDASYDSSTTTSSSSSNKEPSLQELAEKMRKAEIEVSIAMASRQALSLVQKRINKIESDRLKRFEILQDMLEEVCLREMDLHLKLKIPKKNTQLELPQMKSVSGIFDTVLEMNGMLP